MISCCILELWTCTAVSLIHGDIPDLKPQQPGNLSEVNMVRISK